MKLHLACCPGSFSAISGGFCCGSIHSRNILQWQVLPLAVWGLPRALRLDQHLPLFPLAAAVADEG